MEGECSLCQWLGWVPTVVSVCARLENGIEWPFWALLIHLALNGDEILVAEKFSVGTSHPEYSKVQDVRDLVPLLLGDKGPTPPILIRAKAGTGKTWSARQLVRALSTHERVRQNHELVPLLIFVQQLARDLRDNTKRTAASGIQHSRSMYQEERDDLLEWYIHRHYEKENPQWCAELLAAHRNKSLLVVLDGVDEAAELSKRIERFVLDQLVADGHHAIITSRYEGVRVDLYPDFVVMDLKPLSEEQQKRLIMTQLGDNAAFDHLMSFSKIRREHDRIYEDEAFARSYERELLESIESIDGFKKVDGSFDPQLVQRALSGEHLGVRTSEASSRTIIEWAEAFSSERLKDIDQIVCRIKSVFDSFRFDV